MARRELTASQKPLQALAERIEPGSKLIGTRPLAGGVSADVTAFELERPDGGTQTLIVRRHGAADLARNPRIAADEFALLEILRATPVPAPVPRFVDVAAEFFSTPSLVVEFVDGEPPRGDEPELVETIASVLAEIHGVVTDLSFLPRRVLDGSSAPSNPPALLHGDFWPGNTLWRDGRLAAVIDWEDAAVGDPLADVANARLELVWALGLEAIHEFTRAYAALAPALDLAGLPHWDLWAERRLGGRIAGWNLGTERECELQAGREAFVTQAQRVLATR